MSKQIFQLVDKTDSSISPFFVKKLPPLPKNISELIVKYGPYLILLAIISTAISILGLLELRTFGYRMFSPFASTARLGYAYFFPFIISIINLIILAFALPGLFSRKLTSWKLLFFSTIFSLLQIFSFHNSLGVLISAFISFYFLYQIKSFYTK